MAAVGIGEQLVKQVAPAGAIPQMMMRIDDWQRGLEDFFLASVKPVLPDREIVCRMRGGHRLDHQIPPKVARYSAAIRTSGCAPRTSASTWVSNCTKFFW